MTGTPPSESPPAGIPPAGTLSPASTQAVSTPAVSTSGQAARRWWRGARTWILLAVVLALVAVPSILHQGPDARPLGTDSSRPEGGRAVARVLEAHGIDVHPADSLPEALALATAHPDAPVLFHDPSGYLAEEGLRELAAAVAPQRRVLVEPGLGALAALSPGVTQAGRVPEGPALAAGPTCRLPAGREAGTVTAGGRSYRVGPDGDGCFPVPGTSGGPAGAGHAVLTTRDGTTVLGHRDMLANEGADAEGHAVLALWTLGRSTEVVWYLPGLGDVPVDGGTPTLGDLLPDWVRSAGLWLLVCLVVLLLWKGRRHGPLAVEPLPVLVPASETAVGRARLYERSGQYRAAARSLRAATLVRLASALRLGDGAPGGAVAAAAGRATGQDPARVAAVLDVDDVGSGMDLVAAATALRDLEDEVHRALGTATPPPAAGAPAPASQPGSAPAPEPAPEPAPDERTP